MSKETFRLTKFSNATFKNTPGAQHSQDWHHFTQPSIRLLLERDEQSVRLRVVWNRESNPPAGLKNGNDMMTLVSRIFLVVGATVDAILRRMWTCSQSRAVPVDSPFKARH